MLSSETGERLETRLQPIIHVTPEYVAVTAEEKQMIRSLYILITEYTVSITQVKSK